MVVLWSSASLQFGKLDEIIFYTGSYVQCMAGGIRKDQDCKKFRDEFEALGYPGLLVAYLVLFAFLNFSNLTFVVQYRTVKRKFSTTLSQR